MTSKVTTSTSVELVVVFSVVILSSSHHILCHVQHLGNKYLVKLHLKLLWGIYSSSSYSWLFKTRKRYGRGATVLKSQKTSTKNIRSRPRRCQYHVFKKQHPLLTQESKSPPAKPSTSKAFIGKGFAFFERNGVPSSILRSYHFGSRCRPSASRYRWCFNVLDGAFTVYS